MLPKIAVVLTTHNRRQLLARAVTSVFAQDEPDFELIIVDDASADGTAEYLATLADPRVRVIAPERNVGLSAARNLGIRAATAEIVALLDDDDVYLPRRLSVPLALFAREAAVVAALSTSIRTTPKRDQMQAMPDVILSPIAFEWAVACGLVGPEGTSITFRRKAALAVGGFDAGMLWFEGMDFLMRLTRHGAGALIGEPLWRKFWTDDAITSDWSRAGPNLLIWRDAQADFFARHPKLASYFASKIIVEDFRNGLLRAFWRDLRAFRQAGFLGGNPVRLCRDHVEVKTYRRRMLKPQALANLTGPPQDWH